MFVLSLVKKHYRLQFYMVRELLVSEYLISVEFCRSPAGPSPSLSKKTQVYSLLCELVDSVGKIRAHLADLHPRYLVPK